jgi:hypothetical protein
MYLFFWPWQKVRHYKCPHGVRTVYRDLDDALPFYLSDHREKTAAAIKAAQQIEAKLETQYEEKIKSLLFQLTSYNVSNQQHLRAAYLVYSAAPCENLEHFIQAVREVREFEARLTQAQFLMQQILSILARPAALKALRPDDEGSPDQLALMLGDVLNILRRPAYVGKMVDEIKRVQEVTEEWRRG